MLPQVHQVTLQAIVLTKFKNIQLEILGYIK
jgi:hypothetical protein